LFSFSAFINIMIGVKNPREIKTDYTFPGQSENTPGKPDSGCETRLRQPGFPATYNTGNNSGQNRNLY